jgi:hypothetical protein
MGVRALINRVAPFLSSRALARTMIASARDGERVRIVGHVRRHREVLNAPISDKPCVFYRAEVFMPEFEDPDDKDAKPGGYGRRENCRDFLVEDETGQATVIATGAQIDFPASWHVGFDDRIIRFLETCRRTDMVERLTSPTNLVGQQSTRVRYQETIVADGTPVSVLGRARWVPNAVDPATATAYRSKGQHLIVEADGPNPIIVSGHLADWIDEYPLG